MEGKCWNCRERLTDHFQMNSAEMMRSKAPEVGDLSMCGGCGEFSVFAGELGLIKPPLGLMRQIYNTPALMDMQERLRKRTKTVEINGKMEG